MPRILLVAIAVVLSFFVGRAVYRAMASDETRIGWLFAEEAEAFNGGSVLSVLSHFAPDYRDDASGMDLPRLRGAVLWALQNHGDPERSDHWRAVLPQAAGAVSVDGDSATAELPVQLVEGRDDGKLLWQVQVTAQLRRVDGDWRIAHSTHRTTQGHQPLR